MGFSMGLLRISAGTLFLSVLLFPGLINGSGGPTSFKMNCSAWFNGETNKPTNVTPECNETKEALNSWLSTKNLTTEIILNVTQQLEDFSSCGLYYETVRFVDLLLGATDAAFQNATQQSNDTAPSMLRSIKHAALVSTRDQDCYCGNNICGILVNQSTNNISIYGLGLFGDVLMNITDSNRFDDSFRSKAEVSRHALGNATLAVAYTTSHLAYPASASSSKTNKCNPKAKIYEGVGIFTVMVYNWTEQLECRNNISKCQNSSTIKMLPKGDCVNITYRLNSTRQILHAKYRPAYWNVSQNTWDQYLCEATNLSKDYFGFICNHTTDFGLVMDCSSWDPALCNEALSLAGDLVVCLSILSLSLVLFMTLRDRYWLIVTLLLFYLVFVLLADKKELNILSEIECEVVSAILYTLLISVYFWSFIRGLCFYRDTVAFDRGDIFLKTFTDFRFVFFLCIGVPSLITALLWVLTKGSSSADHCGLNESNSREMSSSNNSRPLFFSRGDGFCWINPSYVLGGLLIPLGFLLLSTGSILIFMAKHYYDKYKSSTSRAGYIGRGQYRTSEETRLEEKWSYIWHLVFIQTILGFPWIMSYLSLSDIQTTPYHWIFTIVNGGQGFWIAVFVAYDCYRKKRRQRKDSEATCRAALRRRRHATENAQNTEPPPSNPVHHTRSVNELRRPPIRGSRTPEKPMQIGDFILCNEHQMDDETQGTHEYARHRDFNMLTGRTYPSTSSLETTLSDMQNMNRQLIRPDRRRRRKKHSRGRRAGLHQTSQSHSSSPRRHYQGTNHSLSYYYENHAMQREMEQEPDVFFVTRQRQ